MKTLCGKQRWIIKITISMLLGTIMLWGSTSISAHSLSKHSPTPPRLEGQPPQTVNAVLVYEGSKPSQMLLETLNDQQKAGRITILDPQFGDGILIQAAGAEIDGLTTVPGVERVVPIDLSPVHNRDNVLSSGEQNSTSLAGTGAITGVVTAEDTGLPLSSIYVYAYPVDSYSSAAYDSTDVSGIFSLPGLEAGDYRLWFYSEGQYAFEWYDDALYRRNASLVNVSDGITTAIDIQLAPGAFVTGVVTAEDTGLPLGDIDIQVRYETGNTFWTNTRTDGTYAIGGLAGGSYTVCFEDNLNSTYAPECYDNKRYEYKGGDPLVVTGGTTLTNINASLVQAATITGTVTDATTGTPLENVNVRAYTPSNSWYTVGNATTDVSGTYRISGLAAGEYKLRFTPNDPVYLEMYYVGEPTFSSADVVSITSGVTIPVDMELAPGGHISGRVVDVETGTGIGGVKVILLHLESETYFYTETVSDGTYTSPALFSGRYKVDFDTLLPYFGETYDNWRNVSAYTPVNVVAPNTTEKIDAELRKGHTITGTVTDEYDTPVVGVHVRPYASSASYFEWDLSDYTGSDGSYTLGPLHPGSYRIQFVPPDHSPYALGWHSDVVTYGLSSRIEVPVVDPINAQLSVGGHISGVVTTPDGSSLEAVHVAVYAPGSARSLTYSYTDAEGRYTTAAVPAGTYQVKFTAPWDSNYSDEWYDNQETQQKSNLVPVSVNNTTSSIDAQLEELPSGQEPGTIMGSLVTSDTGEILTDVSVCVYTDDPNEMFCGGWGQDGELDISGWPAGEYYLYFDPPQPYSFMFYEDAYSPADAKPIHITAGMTTTITPTFQIGGSISGTVIAASSGTALPGTRVEATIQEPLVQMMGGPGSWSWFKTRAAFVDSDGNYALTGLAPGQYSVAFYPPSPYIDGTYSAPSRVQTVQSMTTNLVEVKLGETTSDVNATLQKGAVITGVVTSEDGWPLNALTVTIYNLDQEQIASTVTDMDGVYVTPGLVAGEYKVFFTRNARQESYLPEWNNNATTFETAPPIQVSASSTVSNVNASLSKGGIMSGYVYSEKTGYVLPYATVEFYNSADNTLVDTSWTNSWGYYESPGVPATAYKVAFKKGGYATRWYDDVSSLANATPVSVDLGELLTEIDGYLPSQDYQIFLPLTLRE